MFKNSTDASNAQGRTDVRPVMNLSDTEQQGWISADSYYLPVAFAYREDTPFWEIVYCYAAENSDFELSHTEFRLHDRSLMDPQTFSQYLSTACFRGLLLRTGGEGSCTFRLSEQPQRYECIPKPYNFVYNDWLLRMLSLDPIGRRALWLLNFLIRTRWEELHYTPFNRLQASLGSDAFRYTMPALKRSLDAARARKTEDPKDSLLLLYKLGVIKPLEPEAFIQPQKGQDWVFTVELDVFEGEASPEPDPDSVHFEVFNIFSSILWRLRNRLEVSGQNPRVYPIPFSLERAIDIISNNLDQRSLILPPGAELNQLVANYWQALIECDMVQAVDSTHVLLKSARLGNYHERLPIMRRLANAELERLNMSRISEVMRPFAEFRCTSLARLIESIGHLLKLPPENCVDLYLYLQKRIDHLPQEAYPAFQSYCVSRAHILQMGLGFREVLDGFLDMHDVSPRKPANIQRTQKKIVMIQPERDVLLDAPLSLESISWARLRRVLSLAQETLFTEPGDELLKLELWDASGQLLHQEDIPLLNLRKEELSPKHDLAEKLRKAESPLCAHLILTYALPQLTVQLILEVA